MVPMRRQLMWYHLRKCSGCYSLFILPALLTVCLAPEANFSCSDTKRGHGKQEPQYFRSSPGSTRSTVKFVTEAPVKCGPALSSTEVARWSGHAVFPRMDTLVI